VKFGAVALLALSSCGYTVGRLVEHRRVKLAILDNEDERRIHEFDLTAAISREMRGAGIAVNADDAPVELVGSIVKFREPAVVETAQDDVLVGSVSIEIEVSLVQDGRILWTRRRQESANFSGARSESRETARQEVFDRLARWVVQQLEKDW
jgi:hypothetical protein